MKTPFKSRAPSRPVAARGLSAASLAAIAFAPASEASVTVFTPAIPPKVSIPASGNASALIQFGTVGSFSIQLHRFSTPIASANLYGKGNNLWAGTGDRNVSAFAASHYVGRTSTGFYSGTGKLRRVLSVNSHQGYWPSGVTGAGTFTAYAGVQIGTSSNPHFGWIKLSVQRDGNGRPNAIEALAWAFETTPNTPIHAKLTSVPEVPVSAAGLGALALGAAGVQLLRRRRRTAHA